MAFLKLVDDITNEVNNKMYSIGIFIDLSIAFDTIDHSLLIKKLQHYGVRRIVLDWFMSYLANRSQFVKIDDTSSVLFNVSCWSPLRIYFGSTSIYYLHQRHNVCI